MKLTLQIKDKERFLNQANACLGHSVHDDLGKINRPVLIIGGDSDQIVGPKSSEKIHSAIPGSQFKLFKGIGHSLNEERQKEIDKDVLHFFQTQ